MAGWTEDDIATLKAAIKTGLLSVSYGGNGAPTRSVTYQSLSEMRKLLADMEADVDATTGSGPPRYRVFSLDKGF